MLFKNSLGFLSTIDHEYDDRYDKIGDTLTLRDSARFVANDGADITSLIQDVVEPSVALKIDKQKNVAFKFSAKDLTLTIDKFAERYLQDPAIKLANKCEVDCLTSAYQHTTNLVGTPGGGAPATAAAILAAGVKLDDMATPQDDQRFIVLNPAAQAAMVGGLTTLLNPSNEISSQYRRGRMGKALGFDFGMSQNVRVHTNGAQAGSPQYDGSAGVTAASGSTPGTIGTKGWTAATVIKAGTMFSIASVNAVNPASYDDLGYVKLFTVVEDATADGSGNVALKVAEVPSITGGAKNVTAMPVNSANITLASGSASTGYVQDLAYHKHAFAWAMVPLEQPMGVHFAKSQVDKKTGLSMRIVSQYNILTDEFITRCDVAYGFTTRRPSWACRITH